MLRRKVVNYFDENIWSGIVKSKEAMIHGVIIGAIVGFGIIIVDYFVNDIILINVKNFSSIYFYLVPFFGFLTVGLIYKLNHLDNSSMADEIVEVFHHGDSKINLKYVFLKFISFLITIGSGLTVGMEGACKWIGGIIGVFYYRLTKRIKFFNKLQPDLIICMMSGASAGIGAIFKAPLSGTIMALESPFKKDFAHGPLIQSFISAVTSYAVYTAVRGDSKFFLLSINYKLKFSDIIISMLLGVLCGFFSNLLNKYNAFVRNYFQSRKIEKYILGGLLISILSFTYLTIEKRQDILFSGIDVINNIFNSNYGLKILIVMGIFRFLSYIVTFSFGGVGGQFLPIATLGAILGYLIQLTANISSPQVFPLIGIASFVTASYSGLLFGPVLIAEISGEPNLVVLGIAASSVSFLVTNGISNSKFQVHHR